MYECLNSRKLMALVFADVGMAFQGAGRCGVWMVNDLCWSLNIHGMFFCCPFFFMQFHAGE